MGLKDLNKAYLDFFHINKHPYLKRILDKAKKYGFSDSDSEKTVRGYHSRENAKRILKLGFPIEIIETGDLDAFEAYTDTLEEVFLVDHQFMGKKIAGFIPHNHEFDHCFQVECSEYFLEQYPTKLAEVLTKIILLFDQC